MKRTHPTREQIKAAMEFQDVRPRTSRTWVVHFADQEPVVRRYQTPVLLQRVLDDHRAAIAAQPIDGEVTRDHLPAIDLDDLDAIDLDELEQFDLDSLEQFDLDELNRLLDEQG